MVMKKSIILVTMMAVLLVVVDPVTALTDKVAGGKQGDLCFYDAHCLNGGKCMLGTVITPYKHCHCESGFSGPRCSRYCPIRCENGGHCTLKRQGVKEEIGIQEQTPTYNADDYECKCLGYFEGKSCDTPYINCGNTDRCYNGGVCVEHEHKNNKNSDGENVDKEKTVVCDCPPGFAGKYCKKSIPVVEEKEDLQEPGMILIISGSLLVVFAIALVCIIRRRRPSHLKLVLTEPDGDGDGDDSDSSDDSDGQSFWEDEAPGSLQMQKHPSRRSHHII